MKAPARYFEVVLNRNIAFPAYTLIVKNEKIAVRKAVKEAKMECNTTVDIFEVNNAGELIENGFISGTIRIN